MTTRLAPIIIICLVGCSTPAGERGGEGSSCDTRDDCQDGLVCLDETCTAVGSDGDGDSDGDSDADGDSDSDADSDTIENPDADQPDPCPSSVLCGTPAVCCEEGEECYEGLCVAPCDSGVRCGDNGSTCCDAAQVCLDGECATPGDECSDSFDCPDGEFCEPTLE